MLRNYMGIINLEESEKNIRSLASVRPIGTIPVAARYRVIDFILSNMVNAGMRHISVFCKKETRSLPDHLGTGKPWNMDRKTDGLFIFQHSFVSGSRAFDAKQMANNLEFINKANFEYVIISSSYMICNIDLEEVASHFEKSGADIFMVYKNVDNADTDFIGCDLVKKDGNGRIVTIVRNIGLDKNASVGMEMFLMKKSTLVELIYKAIDSGMRGKFNDIIYDNLLSYNVLGYEFSGYLKCINSVESYYNTNMDMLNIEVMGELFNKIRPIYTKTKDSPPTKYCLSSDVKNSVIADGTIVEGKVRNSIVSRNVQIGKNVVLDGCIILQNAKIKDGTKLTNVIVDKGVTVDENVVVQCPKQYPLVFEKKAYTNI